MTRIFSGAPAIAAAALLLIAAPASAVEVPPCSSRVTRNNIVQCALLSSLAVKAQSHELEAAEGRRLGVSPLLPSNPVLSLSGARRSIPDSGDTYNWDVTLAQEIEVAGQRGVRRNAAQAEVVAQANRVLLSRRAVAAAAWVAFFDILAAQEGQRLAGQLSAATQSVASAARARADKGLIAPVDADVADAAAIRVLQAKLGAERRLAETEATIAFLLNLEPAQGPFRVEGDLVPLAAAAGTFLEPEAANERPEVLALEAERKALQLRAKAYRRARVPNLTVSAFIQNDGFNERVLGVGLSLPVPLPGNVGRTFKGEIAEAEALALRAETDRDRVQREIRMEVATAAQAFASRGKEVEAFTPERVMRAQESLRSLGQEVEAGRLSIRDTVVAQQALIELLQANVAARRAWCLASVDLARAVGMPLEKGTP